MNYGFVNVAAAVPSVRVADVRFNVAEIEKQLAKAEADSVEVVVFPELSLTGYSCQDLFAQQRLISAAEEGMALLLNQSREMDEKIEKLTHLGNKFFPTEEETKSEIDKLLDVTELYEITIEHMSGKIVEEK